MRARKRARRENVTTRTAHRVCSAVLVCGPQWHIHTSAHTTHNNQNNNTPVWRSRYALRSLTQVRYITRDVSSRGCCCFACARTSLHVLIYHQGFDDVNLRESCSRVCLSVRPGEEYISERARVSVCVELCVCVCMCLIRARQLAQCCARAQRANVPLSQTHTQTSPM